jgi:hypothetical protein
MVVLLIPLIPGRYVFTRYVLMRGDRWKQAQAISGVSLTTKDRRLSVEEKSALFSMVPFPCRAERAPHRTPLGPR